MEIANWMGTNAPVVIDGDACMIPPGVHEIKFGDAVQIGAATFGAGSCPPHVDCRIEIPATAAPYLRTEASNFAVSMAGLAVGLGAAITASMIRKLGQLARGSWNE